MILGGRLTLWLPGQNPLGTFVLTNEENVGFSALFLRDRLSPASHGAMSNGGYDLVVHAMSKATAEMTSWVLCA